VALAAIVLARFDITLLDEPTNDLDFDGLARLEAVWRSARRGWWWCHTTGRSRTHGDVGGWRLARTRPRPALFGR